ncbi:hypothetical protein LCGC14_1573250, partial [marine sediment metagenome]
MFKVVNAAGIIIDWLFKHKTTHENAGVDEINLASLTGLKAEFVEVEELSTATYDDVQDYMNFFGDRTLLSGGGITDNSDGTATVAAGTAWVKVTDSDTAIGKFFDFSADANVSLTDQLTNFVYLDYNGGTPQIVVTTTSIITHGFKEDHIHIATIFRDGTVLHFHEEDTIGIERINIVDMRLLEMHDADRASGLVTSDAGSLALSVTTGVIYEGLSRHTTTANGSTWSTWHYNFTGGVWVEVTGQSTVSNTQYNNIASGTGLANLTSNRYAVHWVYCDIDGSNMFLVYGQGNYTINQAEEAGIPASLPDIALHYGVLIAKIIVQEGQTSLEILLPWTTTFHSSGATNHSNLANLSADDHTQYLLADGTRALSGAWDMGSQNLTNVNIDSGTIDGVTITQPNLNEAVALTATATELNALTDDSMADALHRHSELSASDGSPDQALVVDAAGQVGIGAASPAAKLEVAGTEIRVRTSTTPKLSLWTDGADVGCRNWVLRISHIAFGDFNIVQSNAKGGNPITAGTSRLYIGATGNVGIGVTDPDTKLEILNAGDQLKLSFDGADDAVFAVDTNGILTITPSGAAVDFASKNLTGLGTLSAFTLGGTMDANSQA